MRFQAILALAGLALCRRTITYLKKGAARYSTKIGAFRMRLPGPGEAAMSTRVRPVV